MSQVTIARAEESEMDATLHLSDGRTVKIVPYGVGILRVMVAANLKAVFANGLDIGFVQGFSDGWLPFCYRPNRVDGPLQATRDDAALWLAQNR